MPSLEETTTPASRPTSRASCHSRSSTPSPKTVVDPSTPHTLQTPRTPRRIDKDDTFSLAVKRLSEDHPLPVWSRDVDVTFHKSPQKDDDRDDSADAARNGKNQCDISKIHPVLRPSPVKARLPNRVYCNPESLTYFSIVFGIDYHKDHPEPEDQSFRQIHHGLRYSRNPLEDPNKENPLLTLPLKARRRIWRYAILDGKDRPEKPVCMQPFKPFLKNAWAPENFTTTGTAFRSVAGALAACSSMRTNAFAFILMTHRFHFTLSPYVTPFTCPEMFHWMNTYSKHMQHVTIELDLTKLGGGARPAAEGLLSSTWNFEAALSNWVELQIARRCTPLDSLVLLARRYHGLRPSVDGNDDENNTARLQQYCSPHAEYAVAHPLMKLAGRVNTVRIAGFSPGTTDLLLTALFPDVDYQASPELHRHCERADICDIWPFLPEQKAVHRVGIILSNTPSSKRPSKTASIRSSASRVRKELEKLRQLLEGTGITEDGEKKQQTPRGRKRIASSATEHQNKLSEEADREWRRISRDSVKIVRSIQENQQQHLRQRQSSTVSGHSKERNAMTQTPSTDLRAAAAAEANSPLLKKKSFRDLIKKQSLGILRRPKSDNLEHQTG